MRGSFSSVSTPITQPLPNVCQLRCKRSQIRCNIGPHRASENFKEFQGVIVMPVGCTGAEKSTCIAALSDPNSETSLWNCDVAPVPSMIKIELSASSEPAPRAQQRCGGFETPTPTRSCRCPSALTSKDRIELFNRKIE